jgi:hypothetical protein
MKGQANNPAAIPAVVSAPSDGPRQAKQALLLWCIFFVVLILFNGTIPFALGIDLHAWTQSAVKSVLFAFIFYAFVFLAVPLILIKSWGIVRQPGFLFPLCLAMLGITFSHYFWPGVAVSVMVLAYLHRRFDLSGYGIRSKGFGADLIAVLLMGILGLIPVLMRRSFSGLSLAPALTAALTRLFANPASSVENLFYFGFLTERLSYGAGKWLTPPLIGLLYTAHEMSNPEYWYGGMSFALIFVGVSLWAAIYLWRRSAVVIWLGDGFYRFVLNLF